MRRHPWLLIGLLLVAGCAVAAEATGTPGAIGAPVRTNASTALVGNPPSAASALRRPRRGLRYGAGFEARHATAPRRSRR